MNRRSFWLTPFFALSLLAAPGCGSDDAEGTPAGSCIIVALGDGTSAIRCPDGSELVVRNGKDGEDGEGAKGPEAACTLTDKGDGTFDLVCGETSVTLGDKCEDGFRADLVVGKSDLGSGPISGTSGGTLSLMLFEMTNCTWVRGDVEVRSYDGEALPSSLSRIDKIDGDLVIADNPVLQKVSLPLLREVGGNIRIEGSAFLTKIGDFSELVSARKVLIYAHAELVEVGNMPKLVELEKLDFYSNDKLEKIGGFDELAVITDGISWDYNPLLVDMGKYPKLAKVVDLNVYENDSLVEVSDFPALDTVEGYFSIEYNDALTSLDGLFSSLESVSGHLVIRGNSKLPQCHIDELLDGITVESFSASDNDETATCP